MSGAAQPGPRSWIATYRLQLHADFTLADAGKVLPYLKELGISHVYLSPCLQAMRGSQHGYDVTDPRRISEDLGGEAAWTQFVASARDRAVGILLDIVPNHMAATAQNPWWDDVLCHGPYSRYCQYFDIRMAVPSRFCVHICSLARPYGEALAAGELNLEVLQGQLRVRHYDNTWPLSPASWSALFDRADPCFAQLERLTQVDSPSEPQLLAYRAAVEKATQIVKDFAHQGGLPAAIADINSDRDRLDALLQRQFYALHGWKLAGELVNYRRFFDISTLVGISTERAEVFTAAHERFRKMIAAGEIDGLRVDHPDGLRDPREYFRRLRELLPQGRIYVEKILDNEEQLRTEWPVDGTVGYEFLSKVNRLWM
ncbi:MAG TPA: alpha-amylase family glycosyl hydrolase, partial [Steroidobacteraceae bacterium]|nr:alpha-amylase family glycosyl hydrolase [Steroidobacteraceae bacterium]